MRVLVQRSGSALVSVGSKEVGKIEQGLVLLVGFTEGDSLEKIQYLARKIVNLRIFPDEDGVMNKSILEYGGSILSISQFTLYGDCSKGNRPSYIASLKNAEALELYNMFNEELSKYVSVSTGEFGASMEVSLTNLGPITIWLER